MKNRKQSAVRKNSNGGVNQLSDAAFKMLETRTAQIAEALADATGKGNLMSVRLLLELAGRKMDAEEAAAMRPFRKLLEDLAAEVQLPAEALDEAEEAKL